MPLSDNPKCDKVNVSDECTVFVHRTGGLSIQIYQDDLYVTINLHFPEDERSYGVYASEMIELRGLISIREDGTTSIMPLRGPDYGSH